MQISLNNLGFTSFFTGQVPENTELSPFRISEVHRDRLSALSPDGATTLTTTPPMITGHLAVGDWVLADDKAQVQVILKRQSLLHRRAAGSDARQQLIAANCDVLFIVSSCNADFNPARIERYLALAFEAGSFPVIILTKADLSDTPEAFTAAAGKLDPKVPVLAVNAMNEGDLAQITDWCRPGQTAALVGSSGVGKTTLTNGLCARDDETGSIREDDAKGRHVTTNRTLRHMQNGGWIIDTPGMRALRLEEATTGIETLFAEITELASECRFSDCAHTVEPGCAVQAAIKAGTVSPERVKRWEKLKREDIRNSESVAQSRTRNKAFGKKIKAITKSADRQKRR